MTTPLFTWHVARNRATAVQEARRVRQFGLHPVADVTPGVSDLGLPGEIWAWQQPGDVMQTELSVAAPVRVGFAGRRFHTGHLGLARTAAALAGASGTILVFDASGADGGPMLEQFTAAVQHYAPEDRRVEVIGDNHDLRAFQRRAVRGLRLGQLRRVYGWSNDTTLAPLADIADMLGFFLFARHASDAGVALVDVLQAPHSVLLPRVARTLGVRPPMLLYRRLFPHLRRAGERGSVRDPSSVMFVDDTEQAVRTKFDRAITGGWPTEAEQRARGGDPTRCAAFETIELLCAPSTAEAALAACRAGNVTCQACKAAHIDEVVLGMQQVQPPGDVRAEASAAVLPAIGQAARNLYRPPPPECIELEAAIAAKVGVAPDQVVVGHGSTEVMDWLFRTQARPGSQVVATEPTFELYRQLAERHGLGYAPVPWDQRDFGHDIPALLRAVDYRTALYVIDLPHSVSGATGSLDELLTRLEPRLPQDARLLVDLVYADFMKIPPALSASFLDEHPSLVVCGSLSKAHCLLGARVGYGLATAAVATSLRRQRLPYAVDSLAIAAALAALADEPNLRRTLEANRQARDLLTATLDECGMIYAPSDANFLLMNLGAHHDDAVAALRQRGARFRDGRRWGLPGWIQVHLIDASVVTPVIDVIRSVAPGTIESPA